MVVAHLLQGRRRRNVPPAALLSILEDLEAGHCRVLQLVAQLLQERRHQRELTHKYQERVANATRCIFSYFPMPPLICLSAEQKDFLNHLQCTTSGAKAEAPTAGHLTLK